MRDDLTVPWVSRDTRAMRAMRDTSQRRHMTVPSSTEQGALQHADKRSDTCGNYALAQFCRTVPWITDAGTIAAGRQAESGQVH